jgi:hypothetical protein
VTAVPIILVDDIREWDVSGKSAQVQRCGSLWCHMFALQPWDPAYIARLHEVAGQIGMRRAWYQHKASMPHYDLVPRRRAAALKLDGVRECTDEELVAVLRLHRTWLRGEMFGYEGPQKVLP